MIKNFVIIIIFTALFLPNFVAAQTKQKISLLLYNSKVFTADENYSLAEAVAVDGEKIVAVGSSNELKAKYQATREIDLKGKLVTPGFNDAHIHFAGVGLALLRVDLVGSQTLDEAKRRIAAKIKGIAEGRVDFGARLGSYFVEQSSADPSGFGSNRAGQSGFSAKS